MRQKNGRLREWPLRGIRGISLYIGAAVVALLLANALLFTCHMRPVTDGPVGLFRRDNVLLNFICVAALLVLGTLLLRAGLHKKRLLQRPEWWLAGWVLVLGLLWVFAARGVPRGDAAQVSWHAQSFAKGDYSDLLPGGYTHQFPFQLGFVLYLEGVYAVFGSPNNLAVQLLNVLFLAGACVALVQMARLQFGNAAVTFFTAVILAASVYIIPYNSQQYGILPAMFFGFWALREALAFISTRKKWHLALMLVCSVLAYVLKGNYVIFIIGIAIALLADVLKNKARLPLLVIPLLFVANMAAMQLVYLSYSLRSGYGISEGIPMAAWVAMGLQDDGVVGNEGWYNGYNSWVYEHNGYNVEAAKRESVESIKSSLANFAGNPAYAAQFFYRKISTEWNEPTMGALDSAYLSIEGGGNPEGFLLRFFMGGPTTRILEQYLDALQILVLLCTFVALLQKRRVWTVAQLLPLIVMLGGFFCHVAWEAKARYMLQFNLLLAPYAAVGLVFIGGKLPALAHKIMAGRRGKAAQPPGEAGEKS